MEGPRSWLVALAGLAAGAAAVLAWPRGEAPPETAPAAELRAEIAQLREDLERETFARQVLEGRLALVERETWPAVAVAPRGGIGGEADAGSPGALPAGDAAAGPGPGPAASPGVPGDAGERPWFDASALADLGMRASEIDRLQRVWEAHQLGLAYARDEAVRGGYEWRDRRADQLGLERAFREELGEEAYDRVLYATGQDNRAVVRDVLNESAANQAGIERGDVIWRYDDQLILHPRQLRRATAGGQAGESVPIEVLRDGELVRVFVPRGPLGARVDRERIPPTAGD